MCPVSFVYQCHSPPTLLSLQLVLVQSVSLTLFHCFLISTASPCYISVIHPTLSLLSHSKSCWSLFYQCHSPLSVSLLKLALVLSVSLILEVIAVVAAQSPPLCQQNQSSVNPVTYETYISVLGWLQVCAIDGLVRHTDIRWWD